MKNISIKVKNRISVDFKFRFKKQPVNKINPELSLKDREMVFFIRIAM